MADLLAPHAIPRGWSLEMADGDGFAETYGDDTGGRAACHWNNQISGTGGRSWLLVRSSRRR